MKIWGANSKQASYPHRLTFFYTHHLSLTHSHISKSKHKTLQDSEFKEMVGGGGGTSKSNAPKARKRVEVDSSATSSLKRAHDGSAFTRWCVFYLSILLLTNNYVFHYDLIIYFYLLGCSDKCNRHVAVALIDFHDCHIQAQIDKSLGGPLSPFSLICSSLSTSIYLSIYLSV